MTIKHTSAGFFSMRKIIELFLPFLLGVLAIAILLTSYRRFAPDSGFLSFGRSKRHVPGQGTVVRTGTLPLRLRN